MDHLFRELAPVSDEAWAEIEAEATRSLKHFLAGRKLVDFSGPSGWETASVPTGRVQPLQHAAPNVTAAVRRSQPLVELHVPFTLGRADLADIDRGADDADLDAVVNAARAAAEAEDRAIFHGYAEAEIRGIVEASPHPRLVIPADYRKLPEIVAKAISLLQQAGVGGDYAMALGNEAYAGALETTDEHGRRVTEDLARLLEGPVVWAPALRGAAVLSTRGGDFALHVGQDFSVGYTGSDTDSVHLYLEESMTFRVTTPEAAVLLDTGVGA